MIIALEEAKYKLLGMRANIKELGSALRIDELKATAEELDQKTLDPDFWSDQTNSSKILQSIKQGKKKLDEFNGLAQRLEDAIALAEMAIEENDDSFVEEVESELAEIEATAEKDQRISVSRSNSEAIAGENEAKVRIAESESVRREREAEANKRAVAAENIQAAKAQEESYAAQRSAEEARASLEKARLEADIIVKAEIAKKELELKAEAEAEQMRRKARGEADSILMKMQAEAQGMREMLIKQSEGLAAIVASAGGDANAAIRLMVADKLEDLTRIQVEAISNLKIDKVTVWDNGSAGADGKSSTAGFISGLYKSVPPLTELFDMAGMQLPEYLGKPKADAAESVDKE